MNNLKKACLILASTAALVACSTTNAVPYKASTSNVMTIKNVLATDGIKVRISSITAAPGVNEHPTCRMMGKVNVAPGKSPAQYIKEAFEEELFLAQAYSPEDGVSIKGEIQFLDFSSVSPADWQIKMNVSSENSPGYSVEVKYQYQTSWDAISACKNVANAFGPAVQELIKNIVRHPQFKELTTNTIHK